MMQGNTIDFGSVQIHKTVLEEIVSSVLEKIEGVELVKGPVGQRLLRFFVRHKASGIEIKVDAEHGVTVDLKVRVHYGKNIPAMATEVQDAVKAAIEKTVDIHLKGINVNVQGMTKKAKGLPAQDDS